MPDVSIRFPSAYIGTALDQRAIPLRVGSVEAITKSFERTDAFLDVTDRAAVSALLTDEAHDLAASSTHPKVYEQLESQHRALPALIGGNFTTAFTTKSLQAAYPQFEYRGSLGEDSVVAAFALEAMKRNVECDASASVSAASIRISPTTRGTDTCSNELFDVISTFIGQLRHHPAPDKDRGKAREESHRAHS